jgi:hypothetical protein
MAIVDTTDIYDLGLHDEIQIDRYNTIMRVPGGWIYKSFIGTESGNFNAVGMIFVPTNDEFEE